ncbi:DUF2812 domain-containing protein [Enterococcus rivorum]|uniref:DUF2812 domain-containing protein n=1 Tax=Enterococcus rivorum TaxID=762845 RepID=UPI0036251C9A
MEKEENYLKRNVRKKGWRLAKYNSWNIYTFEKNPHRQAPIIKIDYQTFRNKTSYVDYLTLFEDSGWSHISGSQKQWLSFLFLPKKQPKLKYIFRY